MPFRRVTILRHEPADPGLLPHFDLLVEPEVEAQVEARIEAGDGGIEAETRDVPTWRCPRRLDRLEIGCACEATPIGLHRRWWLGRPLDETVTMDPPKGVARVVARGRVLAEDALDAACPVTELLMAWDGRPDSEAVGIRIENLADTRALIGRRATPATTDRCGCHPGAGRCC